MGRIERNSNIEILRIILMIMVIILHFYNVEMGGAFNFVTDNCFKTYFLYFLVSLSVCAVNCFMIISGYFLAYNKKVKLGKILDLLLIVIFYRVFDYIISLCIGMNMFSLRDLCARLIPDNYFAIFYIVTYVFSPFLVKLFDSLSDAHQSFFVFSLIIVFIFWPTLIDIGKDLAPSSHFEVLSTISTKGNLSGYSVVQFFVDVIIGMYLRRKDKHIRNWMLLLIYIGSVIVMTLGHERFISLYNYCSIFTVISAICLFLLFNKISIQSGLINFISKSVFSIFCIHTLPVSNYLWRKYCITSEHIGTSTETMILWTVISVSVMFIICLFVDVIVRYSFGLIKDRLCSKCPVIINIEE